MPSFTDLVIAFEACKKAIGTDAAQKLLATFAAELDHIPEDKWSAAIEAFETNASAGRDDVPADIVAARKATIDPVKIYARWNAAGKRGAS